MDLHLRAFILGLASKGLVLDGSLTYSTRCRDLKRSLMALNRVSKSSKVVSRSSLSSTSSQLLFLSSYIEYTWENQIFEGNRLHLIVPTFGYTSKDIPMDKYFYQFVLHGFFLLEIWYICLFHSILVFLFR